MRPIASVLAVLCLSWLCSAANNDLDYNENVEVDPLHKVVLNPGE